MAKPTLISTALKPRVPKREKLQCACHEQCEKPNDGMLFRITETDGVVEAECADCWHGVYYYYTAAMVKQMIDAAVLQAQGEVPK